MTEKIKYLEKTLHFSCSVCQAIYQLIETHYSVNFSSPDTNWLMQSNCADNCLTKRKEILRDYYQEKVFAYLVKKEQAEEERKLAEKAKVENKALFEQEKKSRQELEIQRANALKITTERMDAQRRSEAIKDNNATVALRSILWYPMLNEEWNRCIQGGSHFSTCPTAEDGFNRYSNLRVNPSLFQFDSGKWINSSGGGRWTYSRADDLRKAVALCGNRWFTKNELERFVKDNIPENF